MKMIFHLSRPFDKHALSASGIRPRKMLQAFRDLGYEVETVIGTRSVRRQAVREISEKIKNGTKYEFLYSESSIAPTLLCNNIFPLALFLDFYLFRLCKKNNIPIGLFYRDAYWLFETYTTWRSKIKAFVFRLLYRHDLRQYNKFLTKMYFPSVEMAGYIPIINKAMIDSLPPGHDGVRLEEEYRPKNSLTLSYIGGIGKYYQMHELIKGVSKIPQIKLLFCLRKKDWDRVKHEYGELPGNVKILHKKPEELTPVFAETDITLLFMRPHEYRKFMVPFKLFEYLGFCKPVIASKDTLVGNIVQENGIGWTIDYSATSLQELLERLLKNGEEIYKIKQHIVATSNCHTWAERAKKVARDLRQST
ncbi:MAG TPA: hypothetical protein VI754_06270 [Bacteriovoracaceae bacterium]|nr:hypothetical protein [Bacteriovoracaceae bacterium]